MALFSFKPKSKPQSSEGLSNPDEILAYLEEILKKKQEITIKTPKGEVSTQIFFIEEKDGLIRVLAEDIGKSLKGKKLTCGFPLDRTWFSFTSQVVFREGKTFLTMPDDLKHDERRHHSRASFSPREQVKVTILENLGRGSGVFGHAVEVGLGGMSLIIDKAMILDNEKEVSPGPGLFKPGSPLMLVKVNRIPGCAPFECQGTALRVYKDGRWKFAFSFVGLPDSAQVQIEKFVASRSIPFKLIRRSRKKREDIEEESNLERGTDSPVVPPPAREPESHTPTESASHVEVQESAEGPSQKPIEAGKPTQPEPEPPTQEPIQQEQAPKTKRTPPLAQPTLKTPSVKPLVYTFGRELVPFLLFLKKRAVWHSEASFQSLVTRLNAQRPHAIIFDEKAGGEETILLVQKLRATGLLEGTYVVWAHLEQLNPKMHVKLRVAGVDQTLQIPVQDKAGLLKKLVELAQS